MKWDMWEGWLAPAFVRWEWIVMRRDPEIRRVYIRRLELEPWLVVPTARELQGSAALLPCFQCSWKCAPGQAISWVGLYIIFTVLQWLQCPLVSSGPSYSFPCCVCRLPPACITRWTCYTARSWGHWTQ